MRLRQARLYLLISSATVLAMLVMALSGVVLPSPASAQPSGTMNIEAKALDDYSCEDSEWHFVITQIDTEANVPGSIQVKWANGDEETVPLSPPGYTGDTAHYATSANLDSQVVSATATIYSGWSGQFNLSHGPCEKEKTPTATATTKAEEKTPTPTKTPKGEEVTATATKTPGAPPSEEGHIAVFKTMCDRIGQQDTCNGRDTSLEGYKVDFSVYEGATVNGQPQGSPIDTITVTLGDNAGGQGNTGDGSQGRSVGGPYPVGTYTVCEIEVAYKEGEADVPLNAVPRPEASNGGSTGGTNQTQPNEDCITVELTPGTAELKFLDLRAEEKTPTPTKTPEVKDTATPTKTPKADEKTPTATKTPKADEKTPTPTNTPVPGATDTPTPTPTNTPEVGATATNTPTNTPVPTGPTATPTATNTPGPGPADTATATPTNTPGPGQPATSTPTNTPVPSGPGPADTATPTPAPPGEQAVPPVVIAEVPTVPPTPTPPPAVVAAETPVVPAPTPRIEVLPAAGFGSLAGTAMPLSLLVVNALGLAGLGLAAASGWRRRG